MASPGVRAYQLAGALGRALPAAEITPVRSVDRLVVGSGSRGPMTKALQDAFFGLFSGTTADRWGWLEPLDAPPAGKRVAT